MQILLLPMHIYLCIYTFKAAPMNDVEANQGSAIPSGSENPPPVNDPPAPEPPPPAPKKVISYERIHAIY